MVARLPVDVLEAVIRGDSVDSVIDAAGGVALDAVEFERALVVGGWPIVQGDTDGEFAALAPGKLAGGPCLGFVGGRLERWRNVYEWLGKPSLTCAFD